IGTGKEGLEQPVYYWDPSIGPSGLLFYTGKAFPDWNGDVFVASLSFGRLVRLELRDGKVVREERYLDTLREGHRDERQGAHDLICVLTDTRRGRILRLRQH